MKKTFALLLAATTAMSAGVTAFASDMNLRDEVLGSPTLSAIEELQEGEGMITGVALEEGGAPSNEGQQTPAADPSALVFGSDEDNDGAVLGETILEPGVEYRFPVSVKVGEEVKAVTDELMKGYKFSYTRNSSTSLKRFEIDESKGVYSLYVETKDNVSTKLQDVKYTVKFVKKDGNKTVFSQEVKFQYGHDETSGDYISGLGEGDTVEIDNERPVITATQFNKIAKINNYKNVELSGPSWSFEVNVTDESTKNMVSNNAGIKEVLSKFTEQEFKFFNFAGKPGFSATGRLKLDVSDIEDSYENMYAYRYANGKLYKMNATHNTDEQTLEFRVNKLDNFLVTDKAIKDGYVVDEDVKGDKVENDKNEGGNQGGQNNPDKNVPNTGASHMAGAAAAAAMASLAAGAVLLGKRSK